MNLEMVVRPIHSPEEFAPKVRPIDLGRREWCFSLYIDKLGYARVVLSHEQMIDMRDALTKEEMATRQCEACENRFCVDHCSPGGDVEGGTNPNGSPYGAYAVPAQCEQCEEKAARI